MMSLTFDLFSEVSASGPHGPLVLNTNFSFSQINNFLKFCVSSNFNSYSMWVTHPRKSICFIFTEANA